VAGEWADDEGCKDFVANLKRMLEGYKWSRAELAGRCNYSVSVVSNILGFERKPTIPNGIAFDGAFGLTDMFAAKARAIREGEAYPEAFVDFSIREREADELCLFEHSLCPGIFQTEEYAREVLRTKAGRSVEETQRLVDARLARQGILARTDRRPPQVWALIDEGALRRPVAPAPVMYAQCMRLVEVGDLPNVAVTLVPYSAGGHTGLLGAFTIAAQQGKPGIVNVEDIVDGRVSDDPALVAETWLRFRSLQAEAMPTTVSRVMITRIAEELWNGTAPVGARALTAVTTAGSA
jgi:hypothetical protein